MKIKILFAAVLVLLLSGCSYCEPNNKYTVTALGFSMENESYIAYAQAIDASGGERGGEPETFTVRGTGENLRAALEDISGKLSKKPSFEHCRLVILSDNISSEALSEAVELCRSLELSLRIRLAYSENVEGILENEKGINGNEMEALIKNTADTFGFGEHTALFEIETALLVNSGNFALPVFNLEQDIVEVSGLCAYKNGAPVKLLNIEQSIAYANNIYEGED